MDLDFQPPKGYLLSGFSSKHLGEGKYNEDNSGLGYMTPEGLAFGYYKNSLGKPSLYLAQELAKKLGKIGPADVRGTLNIGGVTGYGQPITPVLMPGLAADVEDRTYSLGVVPPVKGVSPLTLALQLRKRF